LRIQILLLLLLLLLFDVILVVYPEVKVKKVNFSLEQAMKAQRGSKGTALLFL
jgi:hypothetical protein